MVVQRWLRCDDGRDDEILFPEGEQWNVVAFVLVREHGDVMGFLY